MPKNDNNSYDIIIMEACVTKKKHWKHVTRKYVKLVRGYENRNQLIIKERKRENWNIISCDKRYVPPHRENKFIQFCENNQLL